MAVIEMLLIFLQNAWYRKKMPERKQWLIDLFNCYTGKRLQEMIPIGVNFYVENASPQVGDTPDSVFPPDPVYMKAAIDKVCPDIILACGKIAQCGLDELGIEYISAPHPAWRALSKSHTAKIRQKIELCFANN